MAYRPVPDLPSMAVPARLSAHFVVYFVTSFLRDADVDGR